MIDTERQPQTWTNDVLIPLCQNVIGGVAVSALASTLAAIVFAPSIETVQSVALLAGVVVTCGFTTIRFFADDLNILTAAYRSGQQSRQSEIDRLKNQLHDVSEIIDTYEADPQIAVRTTRNNQAMIDACADAEKLIKWAHGGQTISRAACGRRGMGQRAWERANQVLASAGVVADSEWVYDTEKLALHALMVHFEKRTKQSQQKNIITPY